MYVGGGGAAVLFESKQIAVRAVRCWSRKVLAQAPGLRVGVGYGVVRDSLADAYRAALKDLERVGEQLPFGAPLYGLPVVRTCPATGLPASVRSNEQEDDEQDRWISQSAASKRRQVGSKHYPGCAQLDIKYEFPSVLEKDHDLQELSFAIELEDLGGYEGESHIAVVHADGNGIGAQLQDVTSSDGSDADFLHSLRAFSASVARRSACALEDTLLYLRGGLSVLRNDLLRTSLEIFPLRPIVYGGDDLTFVCDGRIGLDLAAYYLRRFSDGTIRVCGEDRPVDACAGVAIVPTKYPFDGAYSFAEELCELAKSYRRKCAQECGSWIDFQVIQHGATMTISQLRQAQYRSLTGQTLHQRPYQVPADWDQFVSLLQQFTSNWPRSRAKTLLQVLAKGPDATARFVAGARWRDLRLPHVSGMDQNATEKGWTSGETPTTPYFDALETLDFFLAVPSKTTTAAGGEALETGEER